MSNWLKALSPLSRFGRRGRQPASPLLALVDPVPDWEPLPPDVAEWMGMNTYVAPESRTA